MTSLNAVDIIVEHILTNLAALPQRPLFVALQGPQGSGKTYTTSRVAKALESASVRTATLSIDDLYLPHDGLIALASSHPDNGLLHGRGQPGTHDVPLGARVLAALKSINHSGQNVRLPSFDKSQYNGEGDRVPEADWTPVKGPLDVVLLEGWCVGFYPQARADIERAMSETPAGLEDIFDLGQYSLEHVLEVNELLAQYVKWWDMIDVFIQIRPEASKPYVHIYKWRLQQEHAMKAQNGGKGMTDEQVKRFIDRYIPGYHFFGRGVVAGGVLPATGERVWPPWLPNLAPVHPVSEASQFRPPRLLQITIGESREVLDFKGLCRISGVVEEGESPRA
ncbi:unnamed protein product [Peniophora sp. CBMAI 1063]|nr:unnamed protein product [Peniophora sp. CBMAI 1063]